MFKDPFIISSLILSITFFCILILNVFLKNKMLNLLFLILGFICFVLILVFDNPYIYELLKQLITYFWYPNYFIFVSIILISTLILIYTLLRKKMTRIKKILNYLMFCLSFALYIIFFRININPDSYTSLYSTTSLTVMRILTITFGVYILTILIIDIVRRGRNEK